MGVRYQMKCLDCKKHYPAGIKDNSFNKKQVAAIKCPICKSKKHIIMRSVSSYGWIGGMTDSKMENFEYRAHINMDKATAERRNAESLTKQGSGYEQFHDTTSNDLNLDEGIHDNEESIVL